MSQPAPAPAAKPAPSFQDLKRFTSRPIPKRKNFIPESNWLAYNWIDKDPELDFVLWAIADSGHTIEWIEQETEKYGHRVGRYTLLGWCYGRTKRPHNVTMSTVMAVLGYQRHWQQGERTFVRKVS